VGTWHDPDLGRPIAAPLELCAELLGVDLATVRELAATVEPYIRADGTGSGASCSLSGSSGPRCTAGGEAATSTAGRPRPLMHSQFRHTPGASKSGPGAVLDEGLEPAVFPLHVPWSSA